MEQKRCAELSDSALEGVAGGLSTVSTDYTYSPIGPANVGPAGGSSCVDGKNKLFDGLAVDDGIMGLLKAAGTLERYGADCLEYNRKHAAWKEKVRERCNNAGPEPIRPNPYDYL